MAEEQMVTVWETDDQAESAFIRMALQEADIPFVVINDVVSTIFPVDGMAVVSFRVMERDADRARRLLEDLGREEPQEEGPPDR